MRPSPARGCSSRRIFLLHMTEHQISRRRLLGTGAAAGAGALVAGGAPAQNRILALAKAMGVDTFPTYDTGDNVYIAGGSRSTYSDTGPTGTAPLDPVILPDLASTVAQLDQMSTEVPVDAPWQAARAGE